MDPRAGDLESAPVLRRGRLAIGARTLLPRANACYPSARATLAAVRTLIRRVRAWFEHVADETNKPVVIRRMNGWAAIISLLLVVPTVLWLQDSILWIAFLSIWAMFATHYGTWLTARVEVREEQVQAQLHISPGEEPGEIELTGTIETTDPNGD